MRYLKKVIFIYGEELCPGEFRLLSTRLKDHHIDTKTMGGNGGKTALLEMLGQSPDGTCESEGILWISSDKESARVLSDMDFPVLGCVMGHMESYFGGVKYVCEDVADLEIEYLERVYRRYKGLPWDICETARCVIRETTVADVDAFYDIYKEPSITGYMENLFDDPDEERAYAQDYIDKVYDFYGFGMWTVVLKETGQVIGRAGLSMREGFEEPELGFVIGVPWQNRRLAYEACLAIIFYGENALEFERIMALVEPGNRASGALCEKLGFWPEDEITDGERVYARYIRQSSCRQNDKIIR